MPNAQLDHFVQYQITDVIHHSEEPWDWSLKLSNGVEIRNHDEEETFPPDPNSVVGKTVLMVTFSGEDTTMHIGLARAGQEPIGVERVSFNPLKYSLSEPGEELEEPYFPQLGPGSTFLPPDPSPDRIAEGPLPGGEEVPSEATGATESGEEAEDAD